MSSVLEALVGGRYEVVLTDEPLYCHALDMAPTSREAMLNDGVWLVLTFAVWNCQEVIAMDAALAAIKQFDGKIKLGIRPMFDPNELTAWCPDALGGKAAVNTPLWLVFDSGQLVEHREGELTSNQIAAMLRRFDAQTA
jgi:hypothetical protein